MRLCPFYFSGAGKFCSVHGLRRFIRVVKSDVRTLNLRSDFTFAKCLEPLSEVTDGASSVEAVIIDGAALVVVVLLFYVHGKYLI